MKTVNLLLPPDQKVNQDLMIPLKYVYLYDYYCNLYYIIEIGFDWLTWKAVFSLENFLSMGESLPALVHGAP